MSLLYLFNGFLFLRYGIWGLSALRNQATEELSFGAHSQAQDVCSLSVQDLKKESYKDLKSKRSEEKQRLFEDLKTFERLFLHLMTRPCARPQCRPGRSQAPGSQAR